MPPRRNDIQQQSRNGEEDIISSLPDTVLHRILSFVDIRLALQTSILSRRWRNVWTSLGILTINADQFNSPMMFTNFVDQVFILRGNSNIDVFNLICYYRDPEIIRRWNAWIIAVIRRRVQQLYLRVWGNDVQFPSCLFACDSLMALALALDSDRRRATVILPGLMCLPELTYLLLCSLMFNDERLTNELFLSCPKLERLYLVDVEFRVNVDIFSHTLVGLSVNNHTRDYTDCRWIDSKFKLHAPNLKVLVCKDFMFRDYILENLNSLIRADVDMKVEQDNERYGVYLDPPAKKKQMYGQRMMRFLRALHKVENLKLSAWFLEVCITTNFNKPNGKYHLAIRKEKELSSSHPLRKQEINGQYNNLQSVQSHVVKSEQLHEIHTTNQSLVISGSPDLLDRQPSQFRSLKHLKLESWLSRDNIPAITYLLKISPILESLSLEISKTKHASSNIRENQEAEVSFQCLLDKLVLVEIRGAEGCVNELLFLEILLKNAKALKKLVVYISNEDSPNRQERITKFTEKLLTFQKASSDIRISFF